MNDLQIGLIGLGVAVVVGVLLYNRWQESRHRKAAERLAPSDHHDILLGQGPIEVQAETMETVQTGERREPVMADDPGNDHVLRPTQGPERIEETPPPPESDEAVDHPDALPEALLDPRIDYVVAMELVEPVPASQILDAQREALARISKPIIWVGYNDRQRDWEHIFPHSEKNYRRLRIGLQLADRRGPLSQADFALFVTAIQQLADTLMAVADMPSRQPVLEQALELDRFCAEVDLEIGMHLVSRGTPFSGTKIRALAEAAGMSLTDDGLFTRFDDAGRVQFKLQNFESALFSPETIKNITTHGLTFLLDVPRVDHGERVFFVMLDNARRFADALQGQIVDDNRQALSDAQLERIKREFVLKPQASMLSFGFPAGGPQALRLFS